MSGRPRAALAASLVLCVGCGRACAAPKPSADDPAPGLDAAPSSGEVPPRCALEREIAVDGSVELGRMALDGARALIGARHDGKAAIAELDLASAGAPVRFVDLAPAAREAPPPVPVLAYGKTFSVGYEGDGSKRLRLVLRDVASPGAPSAELPPEPPDDSLAFDAIATPGGVLVAWDAPADEGSAIFAATLTPGAKPSAAERVSPAGADADTPRLARGPAAPAVLFASHRALPKPDAAPLLEGPGQDPEHVWIAMQPLGPDAKPSGAASELTAESGSVTAYDVVPLAGGAADFELVARDAIELGAGQGGKIDLVTVRNGAATPSSSIADHVGRGAPAIFPGSPSVLLFSDPSERGRSSLLGAQSVAQNIDSATAFEPALDGARPLGALGAADPGSVRVLAVAASVPNRERTERASLRVLRCKTRP